MPFRNAKRQKFEQADRRRQVSALYLEGLTQEQIARRLDVSQKTVSKDVAAIEQVWRDESVEKTDRRKGQVLAGLELLRSAAWDAFKKTQGKLSRQVTEGRPGATPDAKPKASKVTVYTEDSPGDQRFLQVVLSTYQEEARLLGLNAPSKVAQTMPDGSAIPVAKEYSITLTDDELREALEQLAKNEDEPVQAPPAQDSEQPQGDE